MRSFRNTRKGSRFPWAIVAAAAFLAGCSTIPKEILETEPSSHMEVSPQVYVRLSGSALRDMTSDLGDEEMAALVSATSPDAKSSGVAAPQNQQAAASPSTMDSSMFRGFLSKTRTFGAGVRGIGSTSPAVEAVFIGDFSPISVRLALAVEGNWKRMGDGGYKSAKYPLFIRSPQPGLIHAASTNTPTSAGLLEIEAYPRQLAEFSRSDIFISANAPAAFFSGSLPLEASSIPVDAIVVSGRLVQSGASSLQAARNPAAPASPPLESRYILDVRILMKDEATAKAYKPVVRFLWAAAAGKFFSAKPDIGSMPLTLEKDVYTVRGINVSAGELRTMLIAPLLAK
jgi:hypothetical protein